jgi:acyl-CoA hydrolase
MEVLVIVLVEDFAKDEPAKRALTAFFTTVALDKNRIPTLVPTLEAVTDEERNYFEEGQKHNLDYKQKQMERRGQ